MLTIQQSRRFSGGKYALIFGAAALFVAGAYALLLQTAPGLPLFYPAEPMDVKALQTPKTDENKIIIPSLNVNIPFNTDGQAALEKGAWWRSPELGDPEKGGNFIITAHRFSLQPTPQATAAKSPFYRLGKLKPGDPIVIDYKGKRYGYKVDKMLATPSALSEIEAPSDTPKLTLYGYNADDTDAGRVALTAEPVGEVTLQ